MNSEIESEVPDFPGSQLGNPAILALDQTVEGESCGGFDAGDVSVLSGGGVLPNGKIG